MYSIGIDIGSQATKSVVINDKKEIIATDVVLTGGNNSRSANTTYENVINKAGLSKEDITKVVTTGYGRENVSFSDENYSEITCHAKGMNLLNSDIRTILDIGGQDSKAIRIDEDGKVLDFVMNDKCAAGCGRFLEIIARTLCVNLEDLGELSLKAEKAAPITSMCSVFAETEVVSLVAVGTPISEIISGVHNSIASRAISLMNIVGISGKIGMSGGVAKNAGMIKAIEEKLETDMFVPCNSQVVGAIGAALMAFK